jgi:uncharacterized surface protein with fasciclin (FAS1) repeats
MKLNKLVTIAAALLIFSVLTLADDHKKETAKKDIVETAVAAGSFNTLATALTEAGLVDALKGDGPFTVFAPTDEAFAKLPKGTLDNLLKDKEQLKKVLLYHVVSGNVTSDAVVKLNKAETLMGNNVMIKLKDGNVMIDNSKVVKADIKTSNGVIHVIDTVLIPSMTAEKSSY